MTIPLAEYGVLVPQRFNSRRRVPAKLRRRIERWAIRRFHGFTVDRGLVGAWSDRGRVYRDRNDEYRVAAPSRETVFAFAQRVGTLLDQRAVYVRCPDGAVVVVSITKRPRA